MWEKWIIFHFFFFFLEQYTPLLDELRQEGRGFICLSGPWSSSDGTRALFPLAHSRLLGHTGLVLKRCMQEACPARTAPLKDCWFSHSFSSHRIASEFSLIVSYLKSLPPQESAWPPSCGPGTVHSGTHCQYGVLSMSTIQFFTRVLVQTSSLLDAL